MKHLFWIVLLCSATATAATRYIGACGTPNAGGFAAAIAASHSGDSILICPGIYSLSSAIVVNKENLTIAGSTGNRADVSIQNHTTTVIYIDAEHTTLSNLSVYSNPRDAIHARRGADHLRLIGVSANSEFGSGLRLEDIEDIHLTGFRTGASNWEDAIRLIRAGPLTVDGDSRISGRRAGIRGDAGRAADLTLDGVTLSAPYPVYLSWAGRVRASNSTITATYRGDGGWAMTLYGGRGEEHRFNNLTVTGSSFGGGIYLDGGDSADFTDVDISSRGDSPGNALHLLNMEDDVTIRAVNKPRVSLIASSTSRHSNENALYVSARDSLTLSLEKVDLTAYQNGVWQQGRGVTARLNDVSINAGRHGMYLESGTDEHRLDQVTVRAASIGLYLNGGSDSTLANLDLTAQTGLRLVNQRRVTISGTSKVKLNAAGGYGILVEGGGNADISGVAVDAAAQTNGIGIDLWDSPSGSIHGNRVSHAQHHGILVGGQSSAARVYGNNIENSGQGAGRYGLYVESNGARAWENCLFNPRNGGSGGNAELYMQSEKHGNFWGSWPKGSGYSDTCTDADGNGVCDAAYAYQRGKEDKYPMRRLPDCAGSGGEVIAPAALNAVDIGGNPVSGVITTKVAGAAFSLDLYALNAGRTAQDAVFNGEVLVDLLANTATGVALDANRCPVSATTIAVGSVTFTAGRASTAMGTLAEAWRDVRVRMRYPATGSASVTACSADNFAVKPAALSAIARHADWQTTGLTQVLDNTGAAGGAIHKAGQPFSVLVTGYNAANVITRQYDGSPTASLACVLPATCTLGSLASGSFTASAGTVRSDSASYSEVGAVAATFVDTGFAAVDADDTAASCAGFHVCAAAINLGRFVPDHFDISANPAAFAPACGSFTYAGQPFGFASAPVWSVTARNSAGQTTQNYTGSLFKLDANSVTGQTWSAATGSVAPLAALPAASVTALGGGQASVSFAVGNPAAGGGLAFARGAAIAPFDASLTLAATVSDSEGVAASGNPYRQTGIGFDDGDAATTTDAQMHSGRLRLTNAVGSERLPLPMPLTAQTWNGQGWVRNSADHCTTVAAPVITFFAQTADNQLDSGETTASFNATLVAGDGNLRFSAPGNGQFGFADVTVVAPPWLKFNRDGVDQGGDGDLLDDDPRARATFGKRSGRDKVIFRREMY